MAFRNARIASALVLAAAAGANAQVIFDQIGPDATATNGRNVWASQDFEAAFDAFDINGIDDFTTTGGTISRVEAVMGFFNSTTNDYAGVTNWRVEIYTTPAAAGGNLTGNAGSQTVAPGAVTITTGVYTPNGANPALISIPVNISLAAGTYWIGVMPVMDFGTSGQLGVAGSTLGNLNAMQANPGAGFGFGTTQSINAAAGGENLAYRITMVPAPGSVALLALGGLAAARRRRS
jgi:hypothetical protein